MTELVNISVSVPKDRVADVYSFVAHLLLGGSTKDDRWLDDVRVQETSLARSGRGGPPGHYTDYHAMWGLKPEIVKANYKGGVSDYWRPFLDAMAKTPDVWVRWADLCVAIDLPPRRASGMLGAAERRCKGYPPYEKYEDTDGYWFRMPARVAEYVQEAATEMVH
jgi:hypothetical protein